MALLSMSLLPVSLLRRSRARDMRSTLPPLDVRRIERAVERGRERISGLADSIAAEEMGDLIDELRHEAAPLVERAVPMIERVAERATGRRRRRSRLPLVIVALVAVAGVVAYLLWQRRDEEPARLAEEPDRPDLAPAGMPDAPVADAPSGPADDEPAAEPSFEAPNRTEEAPARELAGAPRSSVAPGAFAEALDPATREERPVEGTRLPGLRHAPFVTSPVQLPATPRRSWLPR